MQTNRPPIMSNLNKEKSAIFFKRVTTIQVFFYSMIMLLMGKLLYMQISDHDHYKLMSNRNRIRLKILNPERGVIYDRNKRNLAFNAPCYSLYLEIDPNDTEKPHLQTLTEVGNILGFSDSHLAGCLKEVEEQSNLVYLIKKELSFKDLANILINKFNLPGVKVDKSTVRMYPYSDKTSHILGYLGQSSSKISSEEEGKMGLEKTQGDILKGQAGSKQIEVDAYNNEIRTLSLSPPEKGNSITITIDAELQDFVHQALSEQICGSCIVTDAKSGEILALCSVPGYNPSLLRSRKTAKEVLKNPLAPMLNRAISGLYSPGSLFKIVAVIAALEEGVIDRNTHIFCSGKIAIGNKEFHCLGHHGYVDAVGAICKSCNIFFYELAKRLDVDAINKYARILGLGESHNVNLEGSKKGLVPSKDWKELVKKDKWRLYDNVLLCIGQGYILTTPLQLSTLVSRIASKKQVSLSLIGEKKEFDDLPISSETLAIIDEGLYKVINDPSGTGYRYHDPECLLAGKSGTAQVKSISKEERSQGKQGEEFHAWEEREHALFVCHTLGEEKVYTITVVIEHGGRGGRVAFPIAQKIAKFLKNRGKIKIEKKKL